MVDGIKHDASVRSGVKTLRRIRAVRRCKAKAPHICIQQGILTSALAALAYNTRCRTVLNMHRDFRCLYSTTSVDPLRIACASFTSVFLSSQSAVRYMKSRAESFASRGSLQIPISESSGTSWGGRAAWPSGAARGSVRNKGGAEETERTPPRRVLEWRVDFTRVRDKESAEAPLNGLPILGATPTMNVHEGFLLSPAFTWICMGRLRR
jgi:hypothetical protein